MAHGASTGEIEVPETYRRAPDTHEADTDAFAIAAIVLGALAVFFLPLILGPIGIILAVMARNRAQPRADIALWVAIGGTVAGLTLGMVAATNGL